MERSIAGDRTAAQIAVDLDPETAIREWLNTSELGRGRGRSERPASGGYETCDDRTNAAQEKTRSSRSSPSRRPSTPLRCPVVPGENETQEIFWGRTSTPNSAHGCLGRRR